MLDCEVAAISSGDSKIKPFFSGLLLAKAPAPRWPSSAREKQDPVLRQLAESGSL